MGGTHADADAWGWDGDGGRRATANELPGWGADAVGVVLTGMGDDGLQGSRAIRAAGGHVLTESAESCVVYGMPRVVAEAGLSHANTPLEDMAALIERYVR